MADAPAPQRKPRDEELDVWGLTHAGLVRPVNEDHFLLGSLHKHLEVKATSLPASHIFPGTDERLAFLAMVADGVGGRSAGEEASRLTLEAVSAFATVGLSAGVTGSLSVAGKLIITATMFLGRVGPFTIALAVAAGGEGAQRYRLAREDLPVG